MSWKYNKIKDDAVTEVLKSHNNDKSRYYDGVNSDWALL